MASSAFDLPSSAPQGGITPFAPIGHRNRRQRDAFDPMAPLDQPDTTDFAEKDRRARYRERGIEFRPDATGRAYPIVSQRNTERGVRGMDIDPGTGRADPNAISAFDRSIFDMPATRQSPEQVAEKQMRGRASNARTLAKYYADQLKQFDEDNGLFFKKDDMGVETDQGPGSTLQGAADSLQAKAGETVGWLRGALTPGIDRGQPTEGAVAAQGQLKAAQDEAERYKLLLQKRERLKRQAQDADRLALTEEGNVARDAAGELGVPFDLQQPDPLAPQPTPAPAPQPPPAPEPFSGIVGPDDPMPGRQAPRTQRVVEGVPGAPGYATVEDQPMGAPGQPAPVPPAELQRRKELGWQQQDLQAKVAAFDMDFPRLTDPAAQQRNRADREAAMNRLKEVRMQLGQAAAGIMAASPAEAPGEPPTQVRPFAGNPMLAPLDMLDRLAPDATRSVMRGVVRGAMGAVEGAARMEAGPVGQAARLANPMAAVGALVDRATGGNARAAQQQAGATVADVVGTLKNQTVDAMPVSPAFQQSMVGKIAEGAGQAIGTLPAWVLPGIGPISSFAGIYQEGFDDAIQSGATPEQAERAAISYLPAGALDAIGDRLVVGRLLKPFVGQPVGRVLTEFAGRAAAEGLTEAAQQAWLNVVAKSVEGYDPNRPLTQDLWDSLVVGAAVGAGVNLAPTLAGMQRGQQPQPDAQIPAGQTPPARAAQIPPPIPESAQNDFDPQVDPELQAELLGNQSPAAPASESTQTPPTNASTAVPAAEGPSVPPTATPAASDAGAGQREIENPPAEQAPLEQPAEIQTAATAPARVAIDDEDAIEAAAAAQNLPQESAPTGVAPASNETPAPVGPEGGAAPAATDAKVDTIAGRMDLTEFERKGYMPNEVTRAEWVALQRAERRRLGQSETGDNRNAPFSEFEEFHKDDVKRAIAAGEIVDDRVLADYPDLQPSQPPVAASDQPRATIATPAPEPAAQSPASVVRQDVPAETAPVAPGAASPRAADAGATSLPPPAVERGKTSAQTLAQAALKAAKVKPASKQGRFLLQFAGRLAAGNSRALADMEVHVRSQAEWDADPRLNQMTPDSAGAYDPATNTLFLNSDKVTGDNIAEVIVHEAGHFAEKFGLGEEFAQQQWAALSHEQRVAAANEYSGRRDTAANTDEAALRSDRRARGEWVAMQFARVVRGDTKQMAPTLVAKLKQWLATVRSLVKQWWGSENLTTAELDRRILEMMGYTEQASPTAETAPKAEKTAETATRDMESFISQVAKSPMQAGKLRATLSEGASRESTQTGRFFRGPRSKVVADMLKEGWTISAVEVDAIQPPTRTQFNRMDQREQDAFERRRREAGKKTEYRIGESGGTFFVITKIEHDFAKYLMGAESVAEPTPPAPKDEKPAPAAETAKVEAAPVAPAKKATTSRALPEPDAPFATMNTTGGVYEVAITKGQLEGRPDMYGVGIRTKGSKERFESAGYGYRTDKREVVLRFIEKEMATRNVSMEFTNPEIESMWNDALARQKEADEKTASDKAEEKRKRDEETRRIQEYRAEVDATELPPKVTKQITLSGGAGNIAAITFGDWAIHKGRALKNPGWDVTHIPTGSRLRGYSSQTMAKTVVKALIHSGVKASSKDVIKDQEAMGKMRSIVQFFEGQGAPAWWSPSDATVAARGANRIVPSDDARKFMAPAVVGKALSFKEVQSGLLKQIDEAIASTGSIADFREEAIPIAIKSKDYPRNGTDKVKRQQAFIMEVARNLAEQKYGKKLFRVGNSSIRVTNVKEVLEQIKTKVERPLSRKPFDPTPADSGGMGQPKVKEAYAAARTEAEKRAYIDMMTDATLADLGLDSDYKRYRGVVYPIATAKALESGNVEGDFMGSPSDRALADQTVQSYIDVWLGRGAWPRNGIQITETEANELQAALEKERFSWPNEVIRRKAKVLAQTGVDMTPDEWLASEVMGSPTAPATAKRPEPVEGEPGKFYRSVPDSVNDGLRETGTQVMRQIYERRTQADDATIARDILARVGPEESERLATSREDVGVPLSVRTILFGELLNREIARSIDTKATDADRAAALKRVNDLLDKQAPIATEQGQGISAWQHVYENSPGVAALVELRKQQAEKTDAALGKEAKSAAEQVANELREATIATLNRAPEIIMQAIRGSRVTKPIWQQYVEQATKKLVDAAGGKGNLSPNAKPALAEFTDRITKQLQEKYAELWPEGAKATPETAATVLERVIKNRADNRAKYRELVDSVRKGLEEKYADNPEVMEELDTLLDGFVDRPYGDATLKRALREALKAAGSSIAQQARRSSDDAKRFGDAIINQLVERMGLSPEDAKRLGDDIKKKFFELRDAKVRANINQLRGRLTLAPDKSKKVLSIVERAIEAKELGLLDELSDQKIKDYVAKRLGLKTLSTEQVQKITQLAADVEKAAPGTRERARAHIELANRLHIMRGTSPMDFHTSLWYANILSGPTTQAANVYGNTLQTTAELLSTVAVRPHRIGQALAGWIGGLRQGVESAGNILKTGQGGRDFDAKTGHAGETLELVAAYGRDLDGWFAGPQGTVAHGVATVARYVPRFMRAVDSFFYYPAREAYTRMMATKFLEAQYKGPELHRKVREMLGIAPDQFIRYSQQAEREGWVTPLERGHRISQLIEERRARQFATVPEEANPIQQGERFGLQSTFNQDPQGIIGLMARRVSDLTNESKVAGVQFLKPFLPFLRIPANLLNASLNWTPVGALRAARGVNEVVKDGEKLKLELQKLTPEERDRRYLQAVLGSLMMGAIAAQALSDDEEDRWFDITADGPEDAGQKNQLRGTGWVDHAIRIGDTWIRYNDSPWFVPLTAIGGVVDAHRYSKSKPTATENAMRAAMKAGSSVFQTSMFSGLVDLTDLMTAKSGPDKFMRFLSRAAAGIVVPNAVTQADRMLDPTIRDTDTAIGAPGANIPFVRRTGSERTDLLGKPIENSPTKRFISQDKNDPLWKVISEKGAWISTPSRETKLGDRVMTPDEYRDYIRVSGEAIDRRLRPMVPTLQKLDSERAGKLVDRVVREERERAKLILRRRAP